MPGIFLERVDIVPATGAAVYGADAVSGVVDIRMRRRFRGARLIVNLANSARWDAGAYDFEGAAGRDFLAHRLNLALAAEYDQTTAVSEQQRPWTRLQQGFVPNPRYTGPDSAVPAQILADNLRVNGVTNDGLPYRLDGSPVELPGTNTPRSSPPTAIWYRSILARSTAPPRPAAVIRSIWRP
jgi:outer membrane receptor protein involved in Fe transport